MNFKDFKSWILTGTVTILIFLVGYFSDKALEELRAIRSEITTLNIKLVEVVGNQNSFQIKLDFANKRIDKLEERK